MDGSVGVPSAKCGGGCERRQLSLHPLPGCFLVQQRTDGSEAVEQMKAVAAEVNQD